LRKILYAESIIEYETKKHWKNGVSFKKFGLPQRNVNELIQDAVNRVQMIIIHLSFFESFYS